MIRRLMIGLTICGFLTTSSYAFPDAPPSQQPPMPCASQQMSPPPMIHGPGRPGGIGLHLNAEQQDLIKAIESTAQNDSKPLLNKLQKAHETIMKMEQQETFNEDEFRKAAQKAADIEVELMVLKAKTTIEVRNLLTQEQKNQLIDAELRLLLKPEMPKPQKMDDPHQPGPWGSGLPPKQ